MKNDIAVAARNKAKLRRERKKGANSQEEAPQPSQKRPMAEWKIRLLALIPPILFACYLVWDLSKQ